VVVTDLILAHSTLENTAQSIGRPPSGNGTFDKTLSPYYK